MDLYSSHMNFRFFIRFFWPFSALRSLAIGRAMSTFRALIKTKITFLKFPKTQMR